MGQNKTREKTADGLQAERVTAALEETDRTGRAPAFIRENPGQFLRDMYDVWHRQGGKEGGRWRNSIRKMRDEWLVGRNAVPSLHPKLMGRVKVTRSDARALIDLFLTRWRYGEGGDTLSSMTRDGYVGFAAKDGRQIVAALVRAIFSSTKTSVEFPLRESQTRASSDDLRIETFIKSDYSQCDSLITFSRGRIAVGPNPANTIKSFVQFFRQLYKEDNKGENKNKIFIWVVDFGQRLVEFDESFIEYFNAGFLSLLLQAFAKFDSEADDAEFSKHGKFYRKLRIQDANERLKRWQWLSERSVVIAENLRLEEVDRFYAKDDELLNNIRLRDSPVTQQHILPQEPPPNWIKDIKDLVGNRIDMKNISFTVLLNKDGWNKHDPRGNDLKYYAHARILRSPDADFVTATVESVALSPAGPIYDDAFRILYLAAAGRLSGKLDLDSDEAIALSYLQKLDFRVLKLADFVRIHSLGLVESDENIIAAVESTQLHENSTS